MGVNADWRRVEELFFECEALDDEARSAFLDRTCGDDGTLREQVERLLEADSSVGDRFERIVSEAALDDPEAHPDHLGRYRVLEVLGEGGMGTVYLGERADGTFSQRVAVKVVKAGLLGHHVERRFERERQILARLEHPFVARLLDGGTTPQGLPYLVMEYVDGDPVDVYCDRHRLSVRQRLELFRKVCTGVRAAHRNLVVHRDLKPSNILVTSEGQPKLLDFGISKLLEHDEPNQSPALTVLGQRILTPEYASPEQIRDEPITTAVDVYALGLLLHRLLTGDRPYPLPKTRGEELRKAICDVPAERPSATVSRLAAKDPARAEELSAARATVGALAQVDDAHATATDLAYQTKSADQTVGVAGVERLTCGGLHGFSDSFEALVSQLQRIEERLDFGSQPRLVPAFLFEELRSIRGILVERAMKQVFDAPPARARVHL